MTELRDMDSEEGIDERILTGDRCQICNHPSSAEDKIVDGIRGGAYAWSDHQSCFEAAASQVDQSRGQT
jgi:hypothetical protein